MAEFSPLSARGTPRVAAEVREDATRSSGTVDTDAAPELPRNAAAGADQQLQDQLPRNSMFDRDRIDVVRTTTRTPALIMQELQRAGTLERGLTYKKVSPLAVQGKKLSACFEMDISRHSHLAAVHVVRFKRVTGSFTECRALCMRILNAMNI